MESGDEIARSLEDSGDTSDELRAMHQVCDSMRHHILQASVSYMSRDREQSPLNSDRSFLFFLSNHINMQGSTEFSSLSYPSLNLRVAYIVA